MIAPRRVRIGPLTAGADSLDIGAECPELLIDLFVSTVDHVCVLDDAFAFGDEGGHEDGHSCADIGAGQIGHMQLSSAGDDAAMGITENDARAHGDEAVDEEHPRFEHLLMKEDRPFRLGRCDDEWAHEIARELGPGAVVDGGDDIADIGLHFEGAVSRQGQGCAVDGEIDSDLCEGVANHPHIFFDDAIDFEFASGDGAEGHETSDLDVVRADFVFGTVKFFNAFDRQTVGTDAGDLGAHFIEEPAQVLDMRFACGVDDGGGAVRGGCGHEQVFGGGDARFVEEDTLAAEPFGGLEFEGVIDMDLDAQGA